MVSDGDGWLVGPIRGPRAFDDPLMVQSAACRSTPTATAVSLKQ
jgi:hypothetical protein